MPAPRAVAALIVGASALAALSIVLVGTFAPPSRPQPSAAVGRPVSTLVDVRQLAANGLLGQIGTQPFEDLRNDVLSQARHALQREPRPGRLPDAVGDFRDDGRAALGLAMAFTLGNDLRHGRGAVKYLDAWATEGTLDPACLGTECDREWRIARDLPAFVFAADLLRGTPYMTDEQADRFAAWLVAIRPETPRSDGFQGDADVLARILISAYLDDEATLDIATDEWRARLAALAPDGRMSPAATAESPIADTQEALTYRLLAARIAADRGRVVLTATGSSGASIRTAVDRLASDWVDPLAWPGTSRPPPGPLWELAYALWPDPRYRVLLSAYRSGGGGDLVALRWSTLIEAGAVTAAVSSSPVALGPTPAPATPSPTVAPTPAPIATPRPGPVAQTPQVRFLAGVVPADRARIRLSWPTAERAAGDRSALTYRLEAAADSGDYRKLVDSPARRADSTAAPGSRQRFRVRASTEAAGAGPWSPALTTRMRRYEDDGPAIRTTGRWSPASAGAYSDGRVRYSTQRGATMSIAFHGRAVAIRGPIGPTRGQVDVTVDGRAVARIDLGAARFIGSVVVFERAWTSDGDHRLSLRVVGTAGRHVVAIDAIDVLDSGG
jgi:hypothetical protein